jgi:hypothetical protein
VQATLRQQAVLTLSNTTGSATTQPAVVKAQKQTADSCPACSSMQLDSATLCHKRWSTPLLNANCISSRRGPFCKLHAARLCLSAHCADVQQNNSTTQLFNLSRKSNHCSSSTRVIRNGKSRCPWASIRACPATRHSHALDHAQTRMAGHLLKPRQGRAVMLHA